MILRCKNAVGELPQTSLYLGRFLASRKETEKGQLNEKEIICVKSNSAQQNMGQEHLANKRKTNIFRSAGSESHKPCRMGPAEGQPLTAEAHGFLGGLSAIRPQALRYPSQHVTCTVPLPFHTNNPSHPP